MARKYDDDNIQLTDEVYDLVTGELKTQEQLDAEDPAAYDKFLARQDSVMKVYEESNEDWRKELIRRFAIESGSLDSQESLESPHFNWPEKIDPTDSENVETFQNWWNKHSRILNEVHGNQHSELVVDGIFGPETLARLESLRPDRDTKTPTDVGSEANSIERGLIDEFKEDDLNIY